MGTTQSRSPLARNLFQMISEPQSAIFANGTDEKDIAYLRAELNVRCDMLYVDSRGALEI